MATTVLEAGSHAQAMDWSLVLISQGIESIVLPRESDGVWVLEVPESDFQRAAESVTAYERENATVWRRELKWTGLLFDARAVLWFATLILFFAFEAALRRRLRYIAEQVAAAKLSGDRDLLSLESRGFHGERAQRRRSHIRRSRRGGSSAE